MTRLQILVPILLLACSGCLHAASAQKPVTHVYTGTLARHHIVLEYTLDAHGVVTAGRYFYVKHLRDVALRGRDTLPKLVLHEGSMQDGRHFTLASTSRGDGLTGNWSDAHGHHYPVRLYPAALHDLPVDAPAFLKTLHRDGNIYAYLRYSHIKLKSVRKQRFGNYQLEWIGDPKSGIAMFLVDSGYPVPTRRRINHVLTNSLWSMLHDFYTSCTGDRFGRSGEYDASVTPSFLNASVISYKGSTYQVCPGMPRPSFHVHGVTLDVNSGHYLALDDILHVDSNRKQTAVGTDDTARAVWLVAQLEARYPAHMDDDDPMCPLKTPEPWTHAGWYLVPGGIAFMATTRGMRDVCADSSDWAIIPYAAIDRHPGTLPISLP